MSKFPVVLKTPEGLVTVYNRRTLNEIERAFLLKVEEDLSKFKETLLSEDDKFSQMKTERESLLKSRPVIMETESLKLQTRWGKPNKSYQYPVVVSCDNVDYKAYNRKQLRRILNRLDSDNVLILSAPRAIVIPMEQESRKYPVTVQRPGLGDATFANHKLFHFVKRNLLRDKQEFSVIDADGNQIFSNIKA